MVDWMNMASVIPEAKQGLAEIKHLEVSKEASDFSRVRAAITGGRDEAIREGTYAQLFVGGQLMMSDTQMERRTNTGLIWNAVGHVIVAGLGIGMIVPPVLKKPEVTKLTIIEKHQDVRDIVEAPLRSFLGEASNRLEVITADIFDYAPPKGVKYDTLYFDIWPDICVDTLEEMTRLHRKFARRKTNSESYMESWRRQDLKYRASRGLW